MFLFELQKWARPRVLNMKPYSSARDEFSGKAEVYLDANESPIGSEIRLNRYPHPLQPELKAQIGKILNVNPESIFLGNGSDEAIDLLIRICCEPNQDEILIAPPTYGMYAVSADINSVAVREVLLLPDFQLNVPEILQQIQANTKLIFVCSPNNPTGNTINVADIQTILDNFQGVVVVDEAYIDFSTHPSWVGKLETYPNLVILRTFSKAWGLAGLRLGMAIASPALIALLNKIKSPYNINTLTQNFVSNILALPATTQKTVIEDIQETRAYLEEQLLKIPAVVRIYPSDANFLLVKVNDASSLYQQLLNKGIVVRNRHTVPLCENCLRITVGTMEEVTHLLKALQEITEA